MSTQDARGLGAARGHDRQRAAQPVRFGQPTPIALQDDPAAQRLGQDQRIARGEPHSRRHAIPLPGQGQRQRGGATGRDHAVGERGAIGGQHAGRPLQQCHHVGAHLVRRSGLGCHEHNGRQRTGTRRVQAQQRLCGGNAAECERVVEQQRKLRRLLQQRRSSRMRRRPGQHRQIRRIQAHLRRFGQRAAMRQSLRRVTAQEIAHRASPSPTPPPARQRHTVAPADRASVAQPDDHQRLGLRAPGPQPLALRRTPQIDGQPGAPRAPPKPPPSAAFAPRSRRNRPPQTQNRGRGCAMSRPPTRSRRRRRPGRTPPAGQGPPRWSPTAPHRPRGSCRPTAPAAPPPAPRPARRTPVPPAPR